MTTTTINVYYHQICRLILSKLNIASPVTFFIPFYILFVFIIYYMIYKLNGHVSCVMYANEKRKRTRCYNPLTKDSKTNYINESQSHFRSKVGPSKHYVCI